MRTESTLGNGKISLSSALLVAIAGALLFTSQALGQQQNYQTTVPTDILAQYKTARILWTANIWVYANSLFGILALIEFAWSAAVMLLEKTDLQSWTSALVRKVMWIGAFYALLLNGQRWIPAIIDSFNQIGASAAGVGVTLSPGDVFSQGLSISAALMDAASNSGFFDHPGTSLAMMFSALLIVISYIIITINFIVTVVESYLVVSVGFIFLGFGGSRWTAPYVERYIGLAVAIGIKIVLLYCLISTGLTLGRGWLDEAQRIGTAPHPNMTAFDVMGAALIFMMLCWQIPKVFAAVLGGAPALTGGDLVGTGVAVATGALAAGAVATGAAAAAVGGASALGGTSSAAGAGVSGSGAAGAVGSVRSAGAGGGGPVSAGSVPPPPAPTTRQVSAMNGVTGQRQPDPPPGSAQPSATPIDSMATSGSSSSSGHNVKTVFGGVSNQLRGARRRLGPLPSDGAPHVSPPRMPIDQHE